MNDRAVVTDYLAPPRNLRRGNGHLPPFRQHPLVLGPHLQTIVGIYLPTPSIRLASHCVAVSMPDGDRLAIHVSMPAKHGNGKIVLLVHGLGGCHDSGYMRRTAAKLVAHGFTAVRADLRGCGVGWNWANGTFHAGRTGDLAQLIRYLIQHYPDASIDLVGFSLGGHLVLKYLSEVGDQFPRQLRAALAVAPPLDLSYCSEMLRRSLAGIYDRYFARKLWCHYRQRMTAGMLPDLGVRQPKSLFEFDDLVTAPLAGFASADHYYATVSSHDCMAAIRLPTDIITSADDPMIPVEMVRSAPLSPCMRLHVLSAGGHLGFVADRPSCTGTSQRTLVAADRRWLDWQIVSWAEDPTNFACGAR